MNAIEKTVAAAKPGPALPDPINLGHKGKGDILSLTR